MTTYSLLNAVSALEKPDGVIGFPTDTVYGIGCKIDHPQAVEKIYRIKGRDESKPLILLGKDRECFVPYIDSLPSAAIDLMDQYWPGGLTIILPKSEEVPDSITRGGQTIGIRMPDCKILLDLLNLVPEGVLATTSANRSGDPAALGVTDVQNSLGGDIDYLLEDEENAPCFETPSTIVAVENDGTLRVLRRGAIVLE